MNPSKEMVYNADVYGRVLDSANDPVLRSGRVGAIESVPPGESSFRLEIVVAFSQNNCTSVCSAVNFSTR